MKQQKEKVNWLKSNIDNLIFLESVEQIEKFCPSSVVDDAALF